MSAYSDGERAIFVASYPGHTHFVFLRVTLKKIGKAWGRGYDIRESTLSSGPGASQKEAILLSSFFG